MVFQAGSSRQPDPSAPAARLDDRAASACGHPVTKPVFSRPFAGVGLERPLHLSLVSSFPSARQGRLPTRRWPVNRVRSTRRDRDTIWRAKALAHQDTIGPVQAISAHVPPRDHATRSPKHAKRWRCTIPAPCVLAPPSTPVDAGVENFSTGGLELVTEAQQLWNDCSDSLRSQVSDATWRAWFSSIRPVAVANGTLVLAVPSGVVRDRLEGRFHGLVHEALLDSSGKEVQFRFDVQIDDVSSEELTLGRDLEQIEPRYVRARRAGTRQRGPSGAGKCPRRRRRPTQPEVHLRCLRDRAVQPLRPRRSLVGGRGTGTVLQPLVRLRGRRTGKDTPAASGRELRARELREDASALRLDRDVHERIRRDTPCERRHGRLSSSLPGVRRASHRRRPVHGQEGVPARGAVPHLQFVVRLV